MMPIKPTTKKSVLSKSDKVHVNVSFPRRVHELLKKAAKEEIRSLNSQIVVYVTKCLKEQKVL